MTTSDSTSNSGIYIIRNTITKQFYIGSAALIKRRWCEHISQLKRGVHHNQKVQNNWNEFGEKSFTFGVLETCDRNMILIREQIYLNIFMKIPSCLNDNIHAHGGSKKGKKRSLEVRQKMSQSRMGKPGIKYTDEIRKNIGNATRGRKHSAETKKKISEASRGKKHSEETKLKQSVSQKGRPKTEEQKRKLSIAKTGKPHAPHSLETKLKMSESAKLRWKLKKETETVEA